MLEGIAHPWSAGDSVRVVVRLATGEREVWARVIALSDLERAFR
jgi:hypothetical protein